MYSPYSNAKAEEKKKKQSSLPVEMLMGSMTSIITDTAITAGIELPAYLLFKKNTSTITNAMLRSGVMSYQEMMHRTGLGPALFDPLGRKITYGASVLTGAIAGSIDAVRNHND